MLVAEWIGARNGVLECTRYTPAGRPDIGTTWAPLCRETGLDADLVVCAEAGEAARATIADADAAIASKYRNLW